MSSLKIGRSGRQRESGVWQFYSFDNGTRKSKCTACGRLIAGKNPTNLKSHLKSSHKDRFSELEVVEAEFSRKREKNRKSKEGAKLSSAAVSRSNIDKYFGVQVKKDSWPKHSRECKNRDTSLALFTAVSGVPTRIVDSVEFRSFCSVLDPKYVVPGSKKVGTHMVKLFMRTKAKIRELVSNARHLVIGMDIWTKKSLSASYLGISGCFYSPERRCAIHVLLNLHQIGHPHTGTMVAEKLQETLKEWGISYEQVLLVITDNGSNMTKAVKVLDCKVGAEKELAKSLTDHRSEEDEETSEGSELESAIIDSNSDEDDDSGSGNGDEFSSNTDSSSDDETEAAASVSGSDMEAEILPDLPSPNVRHLPCMPHTLQLVVGQVTKSKEFQLVVEKARGVVRKIRTSSVATQMLKEKGDMLALPDCPTRWNSTLIMVSRLLKIRAPLTEVMDSMNMDTLLASEWNKLKIIKSLLQPFADHTDCLQKDYMSLSHILPSILDLRAHLTEAVDSETGISSFAAILLEALNSRFDRLMNPRSPQFEVIPAAACLLDPGVGQFLLSDEFTLLLTAAQRFIVQKVSINCIVPEFSVLALSTCLLFLLIALTCNTRYASASSRQFLFICYAFLFDWFIKIKN
jgi:hypothetical protein